MPEQTYIYLYNCCNVNKSCDKITVQLFVLSYSCGTIQYIITYTFQFQEKSTRLDSVSRSSNFRVQDTNSDRIPMLPLHTSGTAIPRKLSSTRMQPDVHPTTAGIVKRGATVSRLMTSYVRLSAELHDHFRVKLFFTSWSTTSIPRL